MSGNNLPQPTLNDEYIDADTTADFRTEGFTAKITAYKIADAKTKGEDTKRVLRLCFDDGGADLDFMIPKDKEGSFYPPNQIPGFYDLGRLIQAFKKKDVKTQFTPLYTGSRFIPDIVGGTVTFGVKLSEDNKSGGAIPDEHESEDGTKKKGGFRNWHLVDYFPPVGQAAGQTAPAPGQAAPAPVSTAPVDPEITLQMTKDLIYDILTEIGSKDANIYTPVNRIQTTMVEKLSVDKPVDGDKEGLAAFKKKKEAYGAHRNAAIAALTEEGLIKQDGNMYRIV